MATRRAAILRGKEVCNPLAPTVPLPEVVKEKLPEEQKSTSIKRPGMLPMLSRACSSFRFRSRYSAAVTGPSSRWSASPTSAATPVRSWCTACTNRIRRRANRSGYGTATWRSPRYASASGLVPGW
uniref:(northern house mosquito) hypothetical protein n=1 Tax=Culex pipiens TaxID=7175 RepID=A0A8D8C1Y2_CULPI